VNPTLELMSRSHGIWEGHYTHIDPVDRHVQEEFDFLLRVECPAADGTPYRQTSRYAWADGRVLELEYTGVPAGERVVFDNGRIRGECWKIDSDALYLSFRYHADPRGRIAEMIQISADGGHRARTWHWFRDQRLWRLTLVREARISVDTGAWVPLPAAP